MNDLAETQAFVVNLRSMTDDVDQVDLSVLYNVREMLTMRLDELVKIRRKVADRGRDRGGGTDILVEMLGATEKDCRQALDQLADIIRRKESCLQTSPIPVVLLPLKRTDAQSGSSTSHTPPQAPPAPTKLQQQPAAETVRNSGNTQHLPTVKVADDELPSIAASARPSLISPAAVTIPSLATGGQPEDPVATATEEGEGPTGKELQSIDDWAQDWTERALPDARHLKTKWTLDRKVPDLLETVFALYDRAKDREIQRMLTVEFEGEAAIDGGALTREFFSLAFEAVLSRMYKDCPMMEGERGHLLPDVSASHLVHGFRDLGRMMAHAARNGCRGLPGLSPAIQYYLVHGGGHSIAFIEEMTPPVTIDDVADSQLRELLVKLHRKTEHLTEGDKDVLQQWMEKSNCRIHLKRETSDLVVQTLLIYYIFKSRMSQIEAIAQGLDTLDLRSFLRQNPSQYNVEFVFPSPHQIELTADRFMEVVMIRGEKDAKTFDFLRQFVQELASGPVEGKQLVDLVRFLSGSVYLPTQILVTFQSDIVYPVAHSCFNELNLPVKHNDYPAFRESALFSLLHGTAFTAE
jgi:hypothetical protein